MGKGVSNLVCGNKDDNAQKQNGVRLSSLHNSDIFINTGNTVRNIIMW